MVFKKQPPDRKLVISVPNEVVERLEQLRRRAGKDSLEQVVQEAIDYYLHRRPDPAALAKLTPRLRQVLEMVARGSTTKEIAQALGISIKTADWHRAQLMKTLDLHGVVHVVRYAIRAGVIEP
jgi:DNA-binding NarL/FixJ family response regulator